METPSNILKTGWPDDWTQDWYVCDGQGGVEGPLSADDVFAQPVKGHSDRQGATSGRKFVSRRGFAQWYDANDFAGLWSVSNQMANSLSETLATAVAACPVEETQPEQQPDDEIMRAFAATGVNPSALSAPVLTALDSWSENLPPNATGISPRVESAIQKVNDNGRQLAAPLPPRIVWLSQRAKSRLGDLRNPVVPALLTVLSCGVYYTGWALGAMREVVWHMDHDTAVKRHIRHPWMAWIPGFHVKATWDLACLVRAMEEQDGYTSTRPVTAAVLSVIPPLACIYLQHALNDHWLVHCLDNQVLDNQVLDNPAGYLPMQKELNTTSSTSSA